MAVIVRTCITKNTGARKWARRLVTFLVTSPRARRLSRASLRVMQRPVSALALAALLCAPAAARPQPGSPAEIAAQQETAASAAFRYRAAIAGLLQLKPGMVAAEVGAGSGFVARAMASQVGPAGRVIATTPDSKMAGYMAERGRADRLANFSAILASPDASGLESASVDAG